MYLYQGNTSQCLSGDVHVYLCSQGGVFAFSFDALDPTLRFAKMASYFDSSNFGYSPHEEYVN